MFNEDTINKDFNFSADGEYPRMSITNVSIIKVRERLVGDNHIKPSHFEYIGDT